MKKMKLVMVGNGMAGVRTLEEILKISPDSARSRTPTTTVFCSRPYWPAN